MTRVGFTGTQQGMTPAQAAKLGQLLTDADPTEFHHGDCIGSDAYAHSLAMARGLRPHIHPPLDEKKRAFCQGGLVFDAKPYLIRNHDIVDTTDCLLATPNGPERRRSGTWATIRYARRVGKCVHVIMPNGKVA